MEVWNSSTCTAGDDKACGKDRCTGNYNGHVEEVAISTEHPLYIGNIGMHGSYAANKTADECDLMFSIGCRFNDRVTGEIKKFAPNAKIVHIDIVNQQQFQEMQP